MALITDALDDIRKNTIGITLPGTLSNDKISGTSRNDVLDGGAGSDQVNAGTGNDLLIYNMTQNTGAHDRYNGGADTDTLRLNFTAAEWANPNVTTDIERFIAFLTRPAGVEGIWFTFQAFGLEVRNIERLHIYVDGVRINLGLAPVITNTAGALAGVVQEDTTLTATGQLSAVDVDADTDPTWSVLGATAGTYGSLALSATGQWTYTLDNNSAVVQALAAGETHNETFTVRVTDDRGAFVDQTVTVTVNGTNDAAIVTGTSTASLTETDAVLTASGALSATDIDSPAAFVAQTGVAGSNGYGVFAVDATGVWNYRTNTAHNEFVAGINYTDSFTVATADGTTQVVTVTITGTNDGVGLIFISRTNDAPVITSVAQVGNVSEGDNGSSMSTFGTVTFRDVDTSDMHTISVRGIPAYGTATVDAVGNWAYTVSDTGLVDALADGEQLVDSFTVLVDDGNGGIATQGVRITITGTNDAAIISGISTASLTETDAVLTASGFLSATDVDSLAAFVAQTNVAGSNGYGVFSVNEIGAWSYSTNTAHNEFLAGMIYTDSFTVATADSTTQTVTVTIAGTNDAPVILSSAALGTVFEDPFPFSNAIDGQFVATDADNGAIQTWGIVQAGVVQNIATSNYGDLVVDAKGAWIYILNNEIQAVQTLAAGEIHIETFMVRVTDDQGASIDQTASVTVIGTNDAPVITSAMQTGNVSEGDDGSSMSTSGTVTFSDVDTIDIHAISVSGAVYGTATVDAVGNWNYTVSDSGLVDALTGGEQLLDIFTVPVSYT
ncbi:MAG: VCBS domain-containing protein, partial [Candidatus Nitrotoga sp.]